MTLERFAVRFGGNPRAPLMGTFKTVETARWWAEMECDGARFTIHKISLPEVQVQ